MSRTLIVLVLPLALTACMPAGSSPDGHVPDGVIDAEGQSLVSVDYVWPAETRRTAGGDLAFDADESLPLVVRITNASVVPVRVELEELVMRPVRDTTAPGAPVDDVEMVFTAPGPVVLAPGESRTLEFGDVWLFFGFRCDVVTRGVIYDLERHQLAALSVVSPAIVVDL